MAFKKIKIMVNSIVKSNATLYGFIIPQFAGYKDFQLFRGVFINIRKTCISDSRLKIFLPDFNFSGFLFKKSVSNEILACLEYTATGKY